MKLWRWWTKTSTALEGNPQAVMRARRPVLEVSGCAPRSGTVILRDVRGASSAGSTGRCSAEWFGKTSLLSALTGYLTPTDGEIFLLASLRHADWRDLRKHIGLVSSAVRQMMRTMSRRSTRLSAAIRDD